LQSKNSSGDRTDNCIHTGPAIPAFEHWNSKEGGCASEAFIWVHAQEEKDLNNHLKSLQNGSLDRPGRTE